MFKQYLLFVALVCVLLQGCASMIDAQKDAILYFAKAVQEIKQEIQNNNKIGDEAVAKKSMNYKEGSGVAVEINSFSVSPSKVKKGEAVNIHFEYAIAGADKKGININERKYLWYNNTEVAQLGSIKFTRENGVWESKTSFKVPDTAQAGKYKIIQSITGDGINLQSVGYFKVTP